MLRRLLVSILGFLALWLGTALPAVGAADLPTHPELVHAYAYDGDSATAPYGTAIERGPPTIVSAGRHAVGSPSCGVSACPAGSTSPSADGFDHPYKVARVTFDAGMIRGSVEDRHWDSVDVDHGGVAAKTADEVVPAITKPYVRPGGATTRAQREAVQGQPCVDCGAIAERQVADHIDPLVKEYYRTGTIDLQRMRSIDAVQSQCPTCSARQGADLSRYSREMRQQFGLDP